MMFLLLSILAWMFLFPFEWMLIKSVQWGIWFHLLFWIAIGTVVLKITTGITLVLLNSISVVLNDKGRYYYPTVVMFFVFYVGLAIIIMLWFGWVEFSWQKLRYPIWNKIIFTIALLKVMMLGISISEGGE